MKQVLVAMWSTILWRGIASLAFGLYAVFWPVNFLKILTIIFGVYVLVDGALTLWSAFSQKHEGGGLLSLFMTGILSVVVGLAALLAPSLVMLYVVVFVGIWNIVMGIFQIVTAFVLRKEIENEVWQAIAGFVSILFGAAILGNWLVGVVSMAWLIGFAAIVIGVVLVMLALRLRRLGKSLPAHK